LQDDDRPSPLDDLPKLDHAESVYYSDFNILGSERNSGMGIGPIPVTRINQYAEQEGIINTALFKKIIMDVDKNFIELVSDKQKSETKKNKAKR